MTRSTGLSGLEAARLVSDVLGYFDETVEHYVRRRHAELQGRAVRNAQIWGLLEVELGERRFAAPALSHRQLRRIVYG